MNNHHQFRIQNDEENINLAGNFVFIKDSNLALLIFNQAISEFIAELNTTAVLHVNRI